jgi:hypothetical protein
MTRWHIILQTWYRFWAIVHTLNRHTELGRLITWAERKQFRGPLRRYVQRSQQEEERMAFYAIRFPGLLKLAQGLHLVSNLISPAPRYPSKGTAASYRNWRLHPTLR